jgi:methionine-rich copper-binding protein CopC/protocatechuate 3,4-dioxygenase beta subunit
MLTSGPVPNPWNWTTTGCDLIPPTIISTNPVNMATGVALTQNVVITFSESMIPGSFNYVILPDPGGWMENWNPTTDVVTMTHNIFAPSTTYNFTVTAADDLAGNPLAAGPVANPWNWTTGAVDLTPPNITATNPVNMATGVPTNQAVVVTFSEPINTGTFTYTILPDPLGWMENWNPTFDTVTMTHNAFAPSTTYNMTVTAADDLAGNPLGPGPVQNPWNWTTGAGPDVTPPNITATIPVNMAIGVALNQDVVITFSEPMDTTTFTYTSLPDPGGWIWTWSVGDTIATGSHTDFAACSVYNFTVNAADDLAGNPLAPGPVPNPWNWTTGNCDVTPPQISVTNPVNMATGVALNQAVVITFSEAIDTATFMYNVIPNPGGWLWSWSGGNTIATGTHNNFAGMTTYNFTVTAADDLAGNPLAAGGVANPWNWTTMALDITPPTITTTSPVNMATGVATNQDVVITFSEPINTGTFAYTIVPNPFGWIWTWSAGDTVVTGSHLDFAASTTYNMTVTAADDLAGNPLGPGAVANPWNWTTGAGPDLTPPEISSTAPANLATGVPTTQDVVITFSEAIDTSTFTYTMVPDPGSWTWVWSGGDTIVTGTHADFTVSTTYNITVTAADDLVGNPLAAGAVPNPWEWTTASVAGTTGTLDGDVADEDGDPLEGATVKLFDSSNTQVNSTTTDSNGDFSFTVDAGTGYYVEVTLTGYQDGSADNLDVTVGGTTNAGTITLEADATIDGTIVDANGDPIKDATVELLDSNGDVVKTKTTGSNGKYSFTGIGYGDYSVRVSASGYGDKSSDQFAVDANNLDRTVPDIELAAAGEPGDGGMGDWLWILLVILAVVIVLIILMLLMRKKKKPEEPRLEMGPPGEAPPPPPDTGEMPPPPQGESVPPPEPMPAEPEPVPPTPEPDTPPPPPPPPPP